jgi:hypothetical protein
MDNIKIIVMQWFKEKRRDIFGDRSSWWTNLTVYIEF